MHLRKIGGQTAMRRLVQLAFIISPLFVSGCGVLHSSVVEDYVSADLNRDVGTLSTDASRRLTVVRMTERDPVPDETTLRRGEFCSEPPPDAMVAIASRWSAELSKKSESVVDTEAKIAQAFAIKGSLAAIDRRFEQERRAGGFYTHRSVPVAAQEKE